MSNSRSGMAKYMVQRYHDRRARWLYQLGGKCKRCGSLERLEFDHIDSRTKSYNIGKILSSGSNAKLEVEMAKCQLLCHECHLEKTRESKDGRHVDHGGGVSGKRGCKCEPCRTKKNAYMRDWKKQKRMALSSNG